MWSFSAPWNPHLPRKAINWFINVHQLSMAREETHVFPTFRTPKVKQDEFQWCLSHLWAHGRIERKKLQWYTWRLGRSADPRTQIFHAFGKPLKSPNRKGGTSSFLKFFQKIQVRWPEGFTMIYLQKNSVSGSMISEAGEGSALTGWCRECPAGCQGGPAAGIWMKTGRKMMKSELIGG